MDKHWPSGHRTCLTCSYSLVHAHMYNAVTLVWDSLRLTPDWHNAVTLVWDSLRLTPDWWIDTMQSQCRVGLTQVHPRLVQCSHSAVWGSLRLTPDWHNAVTLVWGSLRLTPDWHNAVTLVWDSLRLTSDWWIDTTELLNHAWCMHVG